MPGGQSRWSQGKDLSWEPLRPELVVEVAYEHMQGTRFRHMAQFRRWRTDKKPARLHLRPARSSPAAGIDGNLRRWPLRPRLSRESCSLALSASPLSTHLRRHSRVGSSSGSGVSCGGRSSSGTCRKFTRMRVHVEDRPRIESTSTSSTARSLAASPCLLFHRSRPCQRGALVGRVRHHHQRHLRPRSLSPLRPWRAKEPPAALRPPSCESAAAMAHRPVPQPRPSPRVPATARANRAPRPCPRADRQFPRSASEPSAR